jgi:hypothetical protein
LLLLLSVSRELSVVEAKKRMREARKFTVDAVLSLIQIFRVRAGVDCSTTSTFKKHLT